MLYNKKMVTYLAQASFFDEIPQMCATNLPVKLSFDKNPLSFEKKSLIFHKTSVLWLEDLLNFGKKILFGMQRYF